MLNISIKAYLMCLRLRFSLKFRFSWQDWCFVPFLMTLVIEHNPTNSDALLREAFICHMHIIAQWISLFRISQHVRQLGPESMDARVRVSHDLAPLEHTELRALVKDPTVASWECWGLNLPFWSEKYSLKCWATTVLYHWCAIPVR